MDIKSNAISPIVSVVMSVYNGDAYLKEAINSILNQTFTNFEFIIINDGSSDNSLSIIQSYTDKRLVCIDNIENKGLIYSLNKGFKIAKGKYIARMDADDISLPERFEKQVAFLESHLSIGVLGSDYLSFSESTLKKLNSIHNSSKIKSYLLFTATICHPTLMMRKSMLEMSNFRYSETAKYVEDFDLWTRLIMKTDFYNLNEILLKYRDHQNQVSRTFADIQLKNSNTVRENYLKSLGFVFNTDELRIHNFVSSNVIINSKESIDEIELWFHNLILQNKTKQIIEATDFDEVIFKMWLDCCGNSNLGLWSYFKYQNSNLKKNRKIEIKLFVKCLIRWIK